MQFCSSGGLIWPVIVCLPLLSVVFCFVPQPWRWAKWLSVIGLALALLAWLQTVLLPSHAECTSLIQITPLNATMLLLVNFITFIVLRYAHANFSGDPDHRRFLLWLMVTVFAVMVTVTSDHLVIFWLSWLGISLSLHQLLMFYPHRPRAALATHKKFILARVAEILLALAFGLLYSAHNSFSITAILSHYPTGTLGWQQQAAAILLAQVALIKCAQLPLHGWLIQVVESPTPVSALLHAGIINLGGFLLILFAPLFSQSWPAQWLILLVAGCSAVLSALIMITRISVKIRLAWSTTAQMGLMLVECGLGLYQLALLHLLAHSCYKAYVFLNSGDEVNAFLQRQFSDLQLPGIKAWFAGSIVSTALVITLVMLFGPKLPLSPWLLVGIAIAQLLAFRFSQIPFISLSEAVLSGIALSASYGLAKAFSTVLLPATAHSYSWLADFWVSLLFFGLLAAYLFLLYRPSMVLSQHFFIALNAGFYLDEWATRITLHWWPIRLPRRHQQLLSFQPRIAS